MNQVFAQGSDRFANARLENGNLLINSLGSGDSFSVFFGEGEADTNPTTAASVISNNPISAKSTHIRTLPLMAPWDRLRLIYQPRWSDHRGECSRCRFDDPRFTVPAENITQALGVSVRVNGVEREISSYLPPITLSRWHNRG